MGFGGNWVINWAEKLYLDHGIGKKNGICWDLGHKLGIKWDLVQFGLWNWDQNGVWVINWGEKWVLVGFESWNWGEK